MLHVQFFYFRCFLTLGFSSMRFLFMVRYFCGHELAACIKLQMCQLLSYTSVWLTSSYNDASIVLFLYLVLSLFVFM